MVVQHQAVAVISSTEHWLWDLGAVREESTSNTRFSMLLKCLDTPSKKQLTDLPSLPVHPSCIHGLFAVIAYSARKEPEWQCAGTHVVSDSCKISQASLGSVLDDPGQQRYFLSMHLFCMPLTREESRCLSYLFSKELSLAPTDPKSIGAMSGYSFRISSKCGT